MTSIPAGSRSGRADETNARGGLLVTAGLEQDTAEGEHSGRGLSLCGSAGRSEALLLILQILFLAWTRLVQPPLLIDDAYIHFRYALNLLQGRGLVFNEGEHVLGTTSPVYALILSGIMAVTGSGAPGAARCFGFACDCGIAWASLVCLRRAGVELLFRHAIVLVMSAEPLRMIHAAGGMEMSFFTLAVLVTFIAADRNRLKTAGALTGLLCWIRPEGVIVWAALTAVFALRKKTRSLVTLLGAAGVTVLSCLALCYFHFSDIVPNSLRVKAVAPWFLWYGGNCHIRFIQSLADLLPLTPLVWPFVSDSPRAGGALILACALLQIATMVAGVAVLGRNGGTRFAGCTGLFVVGYYLFYALANPQIFEWYYVPYFTFAMLLGGAGLAGLAGRIARPTSGAGGKDFRTRASRVAPAGIIVLMLWGASQRALNTGRFDGTNPIRGAMFRITGPEYADRATGYISAAAVMNEWIGADESVRVGCPEIGIFGYYFNGRILDCYGLVSPEVLSVMKGRSAAVVMSGFPSNIFVMQEPEYIMSASIWPIPLTETFNYRYREIEGVAHAIRVFVRRDIPTPAGYREIERR